MPSDEKTIYLARHAKSSWDSGADSDFDRPLGVRGVTDANKMGQFLKQQGWIPECIISSPALRTQQTCEAYRKALDIVPQQIEWHEGFYAAYTVTLLHALTCLDEGVGSVMLVGHNPSIEDALFHLCEADQIKLYYQKNGKLFTTGNVAKLTVESTWKNLAMADAMLDDLIRPKAL